MGTNPPPPGLLDIFEKVDKYVAIVAALVSAATIASDNYIVSFAFIIITCVMVNSWLWRVANRRTESGLLVSGKPARRYVYARYQRVLLISAAGLLTLAGVGWSIYQAIRLSRPGGPAEMAERTQILEIDAANVPTTTPDPTQDMATVPAGTFQMGSSADLAPPDPQRAQPQRTVYLSEYRIDLYEVTNEQYLAFVQATPHQPPENWENGDYPAQRARYPVTTVTWYDARDYCLFAGKRLPSEAEWEKAARGEDGRAYPWGDTFEAGRAHIGDANIYDAEPVGSYPKGGSPYGVYDLAGNVSEWVNDWYQADYYTLGLNDNPTGPPLGQYKVIRDGAYSQAVEFALSYNRLGVFEPGHSDPRIGFRCAK